MEIQDRRRHRVESDFHQRVAADELCGLWLTNPPAAIAMMRISAALIARNTRVLSKRSASWPATPENNTNGRMKGRRRD